MAGNRRRVQRVSFAAVWTEPRRKAGSIGAAWAESTASIPHSGRSAIVSPIHSSTSDASNADRQ
jgi:hypothetical protein